ncbi:hypothetical protein SAMN06265346_104166 [Flavobacterium hercynium]|nr:hypothetical protein SAMN06265346_104166 [Flavobacterium hercynium]
MSFYKLTKNVSYNRYIYGFLTFVDTNFNNNSRSEAYNVI